MPDSPMITGAHIYTAFREKALRARAKADEKVVYIAGCPEIVRKGPLALLASRTRKALHQALRTARLQEAKGKI